MNTKAARISVPIAAAFGLAVALVGLGEGGAGSQALRLAGYPVACACIARFVPIVRDRHLAWFGAHEAAMAAIVGGWALVERWQGVVVNGAWMVSAAVWYSSKRRQAA